VLSGLSTARWVFEGFLPRKGSGRTERLAEVAAERRTVVLYEAPHRLARTLADLAAACGDERRVAIGRELTKLHEEVVRGRLSELLERFGGEGAARGEMVLVIDRDVIDEGVAEGTNAASSVAGLVAAFEAEGLDHRAALKRAARALGLTRDEAYRRLASERTLSKSRDG
jgi:16S rRNA (cytidine1402-2'-O)-methyltransferase